MFWKKEPRACSREDDVKVLASALESRFGDDAKLVARIQVEETMGDIRTTWEAVLARLSERVEARP